MDNMSNGTAYIGAPGEEIIMLGTASVDTQGGPMTGEEMGGFTTTGIAQD